MINTKHHFALVIVVFLLSISAFALNAQENPILACGDTISDTFTETLFHAYELDVEAETILIVQAEPLPINEALFNMTLEILNDSGFVITSTNYMPEDLSTTVETSPLLSSSTVDIIVEGSNTGSYQLFISCVNADGEVISNNNLVQPLACGDEIDNEIIRLDELHRFYIALNQDDTMLLNAISLEGAFGELTIDIGLISPSNQELDSVNPMFKGIERNLDTGPLPEDGVYRLYLRGYDSDEGEYRLSLGCNLADGQTFFAGQNTRTELEATVLSVEEDIENAPPQPVEDTSLAGAITASQPTDATFISTDTLDVDLNTGIVVPLIANVPNTGSIEPDFEGIFGFRTTAEANQNLALDFQKIAGDVPLSLAVFHVDGRLIFQADLFTAETLSTHFALPIAGEYTLGVYRLDGTLPETVEATSFTINAIIEP